MKRVITRDGDMLDALCKLHLGSEQLVPTVLIANPRLAEQGLVYPAGVEILFPDAPDNPTRPTIRLWGQA